MARCHVCGDEGKEGGCPRCGLTPRKVTNVRLMNLDVPTDIIPNVYQGVIWSPPPSDEKTPKQLKEFDSALQRVCDMFLSGKIPQFSMFIAAPPKSGKNAFAYTCMQTSIAQKFSVAPLLSTSDWRRLLKVSQMNPFYKLYGKYQWDTLISRDVLFMFVDHSDDHRDDIPLLKSIMDARASFNLSTFIISDYKLTELVPNWNSQVYTMIYNADSKRDYLRYPVILHRFE